MTKRFEAVSILADIREFFKAYPEFVESVTRQNGLIVFTQSFEAKKLKIVVTTPVIRKSENSFALKQFFPLKIQVHYAKGICLTLRDSRAIGDWQKVMHEKVLVLRDLIDDIEMCPRCHVYRYPKYNKEIQGNPKGTPHVITRCPQCSENSNTTFRKPNNLKSRLHAFLASYS